MLVGIEYPRAIINSLEQKKRQQESGLKSVQFLGSEEHSEENLMEVTNIQGIFQHVSNCMGNTGNLME